MHAPQNCFFYLKPGAEGKLFFFPFFNVYKQTHVKSGPQDRFYHDQNVTVQYKWVLRKCKGNLKDMLAQSNVVHTREAKIPCVCIRT